MTKRTHIQTLPSSNIDIEIIGESIDFRKKITKILESINTEATTSDTIHEILNKTNYLFSDEKINSLLSELNFDHLDKLESYYRKIIEDIFDQYILYKKRNLPDLLTSNVYKTNNKNLSLKDMVKIASISNFIYSTQNDKTTYITELVDMLLFSTIKIVNEEKKKKIIAQKSIEILDFFDTQISSHDRRNGNPNSYRNNPSVISLDSDIRNNDLKTRYLIKGPISLQTDMGNIPSNLQEYAKKTIEIDYIAYREKSITKQTLNTLGGKVKTKDDIGIRIATSSIKDSFTFYKTVIRDNGSEIFDMMKKTKELIDFDDTNTDKIKKRMNALIKIEEEIQKDSKILIDNDLANFEISMSENFNNIKELLEYLAKFKNEIFLLYREDERATKEYYELLKKASIERDDKDLRSYLKTMHKANTIYKWRETFRQTQLTKKEDEYNRLLKYWKKILIIDSHNVNKNVTTGSKNKEKLRYDAKSFIKYIIETLGGTEKLSDIIYERKNSRKGSILYLSSKIHIDLGSNICSEIAVLPTWLISLGEIIAPHKGYTREKIHRIQAPIRKIIDKIQQ